MNLVEIGSKISGGERQRISITELYKNSSIIIFDEALIHWMLKLKIPY